MFAFDTVWGDTCQLLPTVKQAKLMQETAPYLSRQRHPIVSHGTIFPEKSGARFETLIHNHRRHRSTPSHTKGSTPSHPKGSTPSHTHKDVLKTSTFCGSGA
ncbi:hypothetical protein FKM82_005000 [Ascaphus truei]